ncbi:unnamed protein product [Dovyalis caffra]|uniref:Uncharacterized protein n=1 Tax=Dovyalis caffra TaxID=77055 RepID=A0AAV1RBT2_9ROSI|nr:unnamed protein product [Dovyalis caffra]
MNVGILSCVIFERGIETTSIPSISAWTRLHFNSIGNSNGTTIRRRLNAIASVSIYPKESLHLGSNISGSQEDVRKKLQGKREEGICNEQNEIRFCVQRNSPLIDQTCGFELIVKLPKDALEKWKSHIIIVSKIHPTPNDDEN